MSEGIVALDPREVDQLDDQGGETLGLLGHPSREAGHSLGVVGAGLDGLRKERECGDRRLQLVADVRDEVAAYVVHAPGVRVVLDQHQDVLVRERSDPGGQTHVGPPASRDLDVDVPDLTVARDQTYGSSEPGMGQPAVADHPERGGCRARPDHTVLTVQDHRRGPQHGEHVTGVAERRPGLLWGGVRCSAAEDQQCTGCADEQPDGCADDQCGDRVHRCKGRSMRTPRRAANSTEAGRGLQLFTSRATPVHHLAAGSRCEQA